MCPTIFIDFLRGIMYIFSCWDVVKLCELVVVGDWNVVYRLMQIQIPNFDPLAPATFYFLFV